MCVDILPEPQTRMMFVGDAGIWNLLEVIPDPVNDYWLRCQS